LWMEQAKDYVFVQQGRGIDPFMPCVWCLFQCKATIFQHFCMRWITRKYRRGRILWNDSFVCRETRTPDDERVQEGLSVKEASCSTPGVYTASWSATQAVNTLDF
jgi:hypothetical protein